MTCAALAAASLVAMAPPAHADAELTVSPLFVEQQAAAGDVLAETITASATGDEPITVELVHADFGFSGGDYGVVLIRDDAPETTAFSTRGWFSLPRERYRIAAGATLDLPLRIEVPANTPGGTFLGAALLRVVPAEIDGSASQVQAVAETGPLVFISVDGGDPPDPALRSFTVPRLVASGPVRPELEIENRGDEFFTFEGTIGLAGPGKDDSVRVERQFVVPGEPRSVRTTADDKGERGRPSLGSRELGFGRYEVVTRLRIEPTGTTLTSTRSFWVVPVWMRVAGVAALLALVVSLGLLVRWFRSREHAPEPLAAADAWDEDSREDALVADEPSDDDDGLGDGDLDEDELS